MLLPSDQLICGVSFVQPDAYRSPTIFPRYTTTRARVLCRVCAIPQSSALSTAPESTPAGIGEVASLSPFGQDCVAAAGRARGTGTGLK
jgi:hypothetical protein